MRSLKKIITCFTIVLFACVLLVQHIEAAEIPMLNGFNMSSYIDAFNYRKNDSTGIKFIKFDKRDIENNMVMYKGFFNGGKSWMNFTVKGTELVEVSIVVGDQNYQPPIDAFFSAMQLLGTQTSRNEFWETLTKIYNTDDYGIMTNQNGEKSWKYTIFPLSSPTSTMLMITVFNND